eukprot:149989-Ditylum_brightwellii.AAC.1
MFANDEQQFDDIITNMIDNGFFLHVKSDAAGFLGIELDRHDDGLLELKQTALIQRIIDIVEFQNADGKATPAEVAEIPTDLHGPDPQESWSYSSVIGILMYLAVTMHPDIAMALHQCARYSHNPWKCHEKPVKRIIHYLIRTKDTRPGKQGFHGMVIDPMDDLNHDCFCDANFVGLWGQEDDQDPSCVRSRTGFVLTLRNTPILWVSKLQTDIACLTMEA